ncbi:MAG: hypothetical protein L0226_05775 [Acidobacteria bacterium]|nr:hypothetical protein [Acidobacteriota bacterium]
MHSPFTNLDFERFIYRQGQLLSSRDFRDQKRMEEARRWMHNSALHNAWGVAIGYEFLLSGNNPASWDAGEVLIVHPGIAYDCYGRELILTRTVEFTRDIFQDDRGNLREDLRGQTIFLVLRYQDAAHTRSDENCLGSPNSTGVPPPLLLWKPKSEVCYGLDVPILFVSITTSGASIQRYSANRARPQARPKISFGRTVAGQTAWQSWMAPLSPPVGLGLQVRIDTRDAGFQQTPCYFAWLNGSLSRTFNDELVRFPLPAFISLTKEKPDEFTFRALLFQFSQSSVITAVIAQMQRINLPAFANQHKLTVCWIGIEHGGVISPSSNDQALESHLR